MRLGPQGRTWQHGMPLTWLAARGCCDVAGRELSVAACAIQKLRRSRLQGRGGLEDIMADNAHSGRSCSPMGACSLSEVQTVGPPCR